MCPLSPHAFGLFRALLTQPTQLVVCGRIVDSAVFEVHLERQRVLPMLVVSRLTVKSSLVYFPADKIPIRLHKSFLLCLRNCGAFVSNGKSPEVRKLRRLMLALSLSNSESSAEDVASHNPLPFLSIRCVACAPGPGRGESPEGRRCVAKPAILPAAVKFTGESTGRGEQPKVDGERHFGPEIRLLSRMLKF